MNPIRSKWVATHKDEQLTPKNDPLDVWLIDKYGRRITFVYKWPDTECEDMGGYNQFVTCSLSELIEYIEECGPIVGVFEIWRDQPLTKVIKEARTIAPKKQFPLKFWKALEAIQTCTIWVYEGNGGDCIGPYESLEEIDAQNIRLNECQRKAAREMTPGKYPGRFHDMEVE